MTTFPLRIITPEGSVFATPVESLVAPGIQGSFGVMARHAPMISALQQGVLKVETGGATRLFVIADGVLEIDRGEVIVMTGSATAVAGKAEADRELKKLLDGETEV